MTAKSATPLPSIGKGPEILTAHKAVANRIRNAIVVGELPGGTRLVQAELADRLAVSITPVREALRDLIAEGLVDFDAFRAATVHETSLVELEELYELRSILVPIATRAGIANVIAHGHTDVLDKAEYLAKRMEIEPDPSTWVELNREFHHHLDSLSGKPHLNEILRRLADLSSLYVGLSISNVKDRRVRGDRDHLELVNRYRDGDVDGAVDVALRHLADTVAVARASVASDLD